jgi:hypothetical protein
MEKRGFTEQEANYKLGMPVRLRASYSGIDPGTLGFVIKAERTTDGYSVLVEWSASKFREDNSPRTLFSKELYDTLLTEV